MEPRFNPIQSDRSDFIHIFIFIKINSRLAVTGHHIHKPQLIYTESKSSQVNYNSIVECKNKRENEIFIIIYRSFFLASLYYYGSMVVMIFQFQTNPNPNPQETNQPTKRKKKTNQNRKV